MAERWGDKSLMFDYKMHEVCSWILNLESEYNLFDLSLQGVRIWKLIRFEIFLGACKALGIYGEAHAQSTVRSKLEFLFLGLYNSIVHNPFVGSDTGKILIFRHPRKVSVSGNWLDVYTQPLVEELEPKSYEIFESPYLTKHFLTAEDRNIRYLDHMLLSNAFHYVFKSLKKLFSAADISMITELENRFFKKFGYRPFFERIIARNITRFKVSEVYYNRLIRKKMPRKIVLVVSYGREALISAARKNNVEVVELQHGTMSPYHLGYSFPCSDCEIPYFPDRIFSFGNFWKDTVAIPLSKDKIHNVGFPFLSYKLRRLEGIKKKKQIVFISQGTIGKQLSEIAVAAAKVLKDYMFIYKLHPGEYRRWKSDYIELNSCMGLGNLLIVDTNREDLHLLLASSEFQVGVYSTAIFEGTALNCKTILINLPGVEYMTTLVEKGVVRLVNNAEELVGAVQNFSTSSSFDSEYFFKNYHVGDMKRMLLDDDPVQNKLG
ncbi:MAG: hypothetical protein GQF41_0488 [Candidatus Rifleibacterium amylolyticum]|nr:MAG: hypothetical protein GQF41_0488 [Candidatus Rifleibacterium amylolyticum]